VEDVLGCATAPENSSWLAVEDALAFRNVGFDQRMVVMAILVHSRGIGW